MKIKQSNPKIKAMVFGGCSFTWGQGLWYYSALDTLDEDTPYGYNPGLVTAVQQEFRKKWRWPTTVANHFGTIALTHRNNGGANDQIVEYWTACFANNEPVRVRAFDKIAMTELTQPVAFSEVSHFVFQFTQWARSSINININGVSTPLDYYQRSDHRRPELKEPFEHWLEHESGFRNSVNESKVGKFNEWILKRDVEQVKEFLQYLESNGIKTSILCWPWEHCKYIDIDPWLSERHIKLDYNGKQYRCIEELIVNAGPGLSIETDTEFFEVPPIDGHPSLKCNGVIAENVIKHIEKQNG